MADGVTLTFDHARFTQAIQRYFAGVDREAEKSVRRIAFNVRTRILAYTPIGQTHRLIRGWRGPTRRQESRTSIAYAISTRVPYARVIEYGGYKGVGPRTIQLAGRALGHDFQAPGGIYSLQAPHGVVQRALADEATQLMASIRHDVKVQWGKG